MLSKYCASISEIILCVFATLCILLYLTIKNKYNYWLNRNVTFKNPLFLFGNYKEFLFLRSTIGEIYTKIYWEFPHNDFVGCFKGRNPELLIKDPEMIKQVLVKDFAIFAERNEYITDEVEKLNANLFCVHGDRWKTMRQKFTQIFSTAKIKNMLPLVAEKADELQMILAEKIKAQEDIDVTKLTKGYTTDVIGSVGFGIRTNCMTDFKSHFFTMGHEIFKASPLNTFKLCFRAFSPTLFRLLRMRVLSEKAEQFFISLVKEIVRERQLGQFKRNDFIDLLLELKEKGYLSKEDDGVRIEFTDVFMTAQAFVFFVAGSETSSTLMSFTLYELAKHQDVQQKVFDEIDCVLQNYNGKISYEALNDMHYFDCVISEVMRRYPALGVLTRICKSEYTFPGTEITIGKGVSIVVPVYALHHDPQFYRDPEKFIPERFSIEEKQKRHPMVYLPFGEGPRNCIGQRYGRLQSMVGLVALLSKFSIEPSANTPETMAFNPMSFVSVPSGEIYLKIKPRV